MHVKRFAEAKPYEAPNHRGVVGLRLQGFEPGGPGNQWVGFSQFLPGGAGPDATPFEKVYVVLEGQMTITLGPHTYALDPGDCLHMHPDRAGITFRNPAATPARYAVILTLKAA